jgi:hypothetical protein
LGPWDNAVCRVRLLSAAAGAVLVNIQHHAPPAQGAWHAVHALQYGIGCQTILQLLLLVVQQLQAVPAQQRANFLHSSAGATVLQCLSQMPMGYVDKLPLAFAVLSGGTQGGAALMAQQQDDTEGGWMYGMTGRTLVEQLLLPALLLQPSTRGSRSTSGMNMRASCSQVEGAGSGSSCQGNGNDDRGDSSPSTGGSSSRGSPVSHLDEGCNPQPGARDTAAAAHVAAFDRMVMMFGPGESHCVSTCLMKQVHAVRGWSCNRFQMPPVARHRALGCVPNNGVPAILLHNASAGGVRSIQQPSSFYCTFRMPR